MRTKIVTLCCLLLPGISLAENMHHADEHPTIFHAFRLETDVGNSREGTLATWDFDGWIGSDYNKLWLKSEGERVDNDTHQSEYWALYSRNIATFWDAQIGVRHDTDPRSTSYLVAGFEGLAPHFFETEAHIFVSDDGEVTARLRQENDFLITQRLITQPYIELNFSAQDAEEQEIGAGLTSGELGLQTRYEITRKFAPYVDVRYERKFGETSALARKHGESRDDLIASIGLRLMF